MFSLSLLGICDPGLTKPLFKSKVFLGRSPHHFPVHPTNNMKTLLLIVMLAASGAYNYYQHTKLETYEKNIKLVSSVSFVRLSGIMSMDTPGDYVTAMVTPLDPSTRAPSKENPSSTQLIRKSSLVKNGAVGRLVIDGIDFKNKKPYFMIEVLEHAYTGGEKK